MESNNHSPGDIDSWPQSFKTALSLVINNPSPVFLIWSKDLYTFPNEKFLENYSSKKDVNEIKGATADLAIPEFWNHIKGDVMNLFKHGRAFQKTVYLDSFGHPDADYYNMLSLNAIPVPLEDENIGGVMITCMDVKPNYMMANELKERMKEQELIQKLSFLQEDSSTIEDFLSKLTGLIPPAMQFPNIAEVSVEFGDKVFRSENFDDCKSTVFTVTQPTSKNEIVIKVGYTQETSHATINSVFVQKEKKLVETLAGQAALIIDRQFAKQDVQKLNSEFNQLLSAIPGGLLILNSDWKITLINEKAEELLNKKQNDVIEQTFWKVFPKIRSSKLLQAYRKAVNKNKTVSEVEFIPSLGKWFDVSIQPAENGISVYFDDISDELTEQKKSEDLSTILDEIRNGVMVTNEENRIEWVNNAFAKITGFSQSEAAGKTLEMLLIGPDTDLEVTEQLSESIKQQQLFSGQILSYTKKGEEIWLKLNVIPAFDNNGKLKQFITILEDISRQKQLDDLLKKVQQMAKVGGWDYEMAGNKWTRAIERADYPDNNFVRVFDSIPDIEQRSLLESRYNQNRKLIEAFLDQTDIAIWITDSDNKLLFLNNKSRKIFGIHDEELDGKSISAILDGEIAGRFRESVNRVIESSEPISFEDSIVSGKPEEVYLTFVCPLTPNSKKENAVIAASINITEFKRREKELNDTVKDHETKLAEIHHRVKNNLAVVSGLMQLQSFNTDIEELADLLNVSVSRIRSIAGIHEQLYQSESYSKIDLSKSLKRLVNEVIATMEVATKIHLKLNLESVFMTMEHATPFSLIVNEVMTNILKHAFVDRDEGTITMNLSERDYNVYLEIKDNGVGLPKDFDMKKSDSLGMELISSLSDQLNARITYESYGEGTRFTLTFQNTVTNL